MTASLAERLRKEAPPEVTQFNVRMPVTLKQRLQTLADREGITLTDLMIAASEDVLEKYGKPPKIRPRKRGQ